MNRVSDLSPAEVRLELQFAEMAAAEEYVTSLSDTEAAEALEQLLADREAAGMLAEMAEATR